MTRIVRTGVEIGLEHDAAMTSADAVHRRELTAREKPGEIALLRSQHFVDVVIEEQPERWHGNEWHTYVELDRDPTNQLMELVDDHRAHSSNLYTDVVYAWQAGITRWDFYGAPFHVELSPALEERLADVWDSRRR